MKSRMLINIIKASQGIVLIAFLAFAVLGASNLDSKEEIAPGEFAIYLFILIWMFLLLVLFEKVGKELKKNWIAQDRERKRLKQVHKNKRVFYDVRHCKRGWESKSM